MKVVFGARAPLQVFGPVVVLVAIQVIHFVRAVRANTEGFRNGAMHEHRARLAFVA
ncbi:MAG TPA: hypothetical protein PK400_13335 [Phycisphaerales bacterium]|nr:hypothetical protein [Phycisphaerales bacterium]